MFHLRLWFCSSIVAVLSSLVHLQVWMLDETFIRISFTSNWCSFSSAAHSSALNFIEPLFVCLVFSILRVSETDSIKARRLPPHFPYLFREAGTNSFLSIDSGLQGMFNVTHVHFGTCSRTSILPQWLWTLCWFWKAALIFPISIETSSSLKQEKPIGIAIKNFEDFLKILHDYTCSCSINLNMARHAINALKMKNEYPSQQPPRQGTLDDLVF